MRRIDQLVTLVRKLTENTTFSEGVGISDEEIIQAINDGQDRILSQIQLAHPKIFIKELEVQAVSGQQSYSMPTDCYLSTRLERVEFSQSGRPQEYYNLRAVERWERDQFATGLPYSYIRQDQELFLQPTPQAAGLIRLTYQRAIPKLDKRRATVSSAVLTGNEITTLTLDSTLSIDNEAIIDEGYICIVDKDGRIKMQAIPVDDVNTTSGLVTVSAGFTFESGETIPTGSYAVLGKFSTTTSQLPEVCEKYLIQCGVWKVQKRDSSGDSQEARDEKLEMEDEIISAFSQADTDVHRIPLINSDYAYPGWG